MKYKPATKDTAPTDAEFIKFLAEFKKFCVKNKGGTCEMLLLTGLHGEYSPAKLNNLTMEQVGKIVTTATAQGVTFNKILADSCCAVAGLSILSAILAPGGEAIGDRMTSQGHFFNEALNDSVDRLSADLSAPGNRATLARRSINAAVSEGLKGRSAPIRITRGDSGLTAVSTTAAEVEACVIKKYVDSMNLDEATVRSMGLADGELGYLAADLAASGALIPTTELATRDEFLKMTPTREGFIVPPVVVSPPVVTPSSPEPDVAAAILAVLGGSPKPTEKIALQPVGSIQALDKGVKKEEVQVAVVSPIGV